MTIGTKLFTAICGKKVGEDEFGNRYFTSKKGRRWVMYNGMAEASKVPAIWHRWLHKTTNEVPTDNGKRHNWQKTHTPNLSGTLGAHAPKAYAKPDSYTPWKPE